MRRREINILASSDPNAGAQNVSSDGSRFDITLYEPIQVPSDAENVTVTMEEATVWWTIPNIVTGVNDQFKVVDDGTHSGTALTYNITIPQGLYDLSGLNQTLQREIAQYPGGDPTSSPSLIALSGDTATNKVEITVNYTGVQIDFTIANSCRVILGFNSQVLGPTVAAPTVYVADNVAGFNVVNSLIISSDIVSRGIRFNNTYSQILDQVLITVAPGSQIVQTKFRPPVIDESRLAGAIINRISFQLTDENLNAVNTAGEAYTARIVIRYEVKI